MRRVYDRRPAERIPAMTRFPLPGTSDAVVAVPAFHLDVRTLSPAWTDFNRGDPGVALLELLAYLADAIASYHDAIAAEQRLRRRRYALAVGTLALALFVWWPRDGTDDE
jgi:hypothetical protein